jgi:hypothetical protein
MIYHGEAGDHILLKAIKYNLIDDLSRNERASLIENVFDLNISDPRQLPHLIAN